ncbi:MAG: methyltransferase domain-containing protein [Nostocoides sp.]
MQCDYFDASSCRSCQFMGTPYADQLTQLTTRVQAALGDHLPADVLEPVVSGPESGFRNKAKLAVAGVKHSPTFGILDPHGEGIDLRHCGLYEPGLADALPVLADVVTTAGFTPYNVPRRTGELKHLLVTHSPDHELMIRFVLRSEGQLGLLRRTMPVLRRALPGTAVVSASLLPEHKAVVEGDEEVILTGSDTLPMRLGTTTLHLRPKSFFQTNTRIARALYDTAARWAAPLRPAATWDLYGGVGGFALSLNQVNTTSIEVSPEATVSAQRSAAEQGLNCAETGQFVTGDATAYAREHDVPDLVVVNPPRRGIGAALAERLEHSGARWVLYSSCQVDSLAQDVARMPSFEVTRAQPFAMFPQTSHAEVLTLLTRS